MFHTRDTWFERLREDFEAAWHSSHSTGGPETTLFRQADFDLLGPFKLS